MGNTGTALQGIYSLTANPAGLVGLECPVINLGYQYHFLTADISSQTALLGLPTKLGVFGLAVHRYGLHGAYDDTKAGLSFAKRFGPRFSVGLSTSYHQLFIPAYLHATALSVDMGLQYRFEHGPTIGFQYVNIGEVDYGDEVSGDIPTFLRIGASYPLGQVVITADGVYRLVHSLGGRMGLEYSVGDLLCLRGGLGVNPLQQHVGFGIHWQRLVFDVAATFHPRLGTSPQIGVSYVFD